jgi:hypothetical protein
MRSTTLSDEEACRTPAEPPFGAVSDSLAITGRDAQVTSLAREITTAHARLQALAPG